MLGDNAGAERVPLQRPEFCVDSLVEAAWENARVLASVPVGSSRERDLCSAEASFIRDLMSFRVGSVALGRFPPARLKSVCSDRLDGGVAGSGSRSRSTLALAFVTDATIRPFTASFAGDRKVLDQVRFPNTRRTAKSTRRALSKSSSQMEPEFASGVFNLFGRARFVIASPAYKSSLCSTSLVSNVCSRATLKCTRAPRCLPKKVLPLRGGSHQT